MPDFSSRLFLRAPLVLCILAAATVLMGARDAASKTIVRFHTTLGHIDIRLFDTATPNSVQNFLNYLNSNRYQDTFIHRVPQRFGESSDFVVQGGGFLLNDSIFNATGIVTDPPIGNEPGLTNIEGTFAFAKNSLGATSQWFFNVGDNSSLDLQDFTVIGRVIRNRFQTVLDINDLPAVNASVAENVPGEDFDEVPVTDLDTVLANGDITPSEAVMINSAFILPLHPADYNFDQTLSVADYHVWREQFGSSLRIEDHVAGSPSTTMEADGNGDGVVDLADFTVWRDAYTALGGGGGVGLLPEPSAALLLLIALLGAARRSRFVA